MGTVCLAEEDAREGAFFAGAVFLAVAAGFFVAVVLAFLGVEVLAVLFIVRTADTFFDGVDDAFFFPDDALVRVVDGVAFLAVRDALAAPPAFFLLTDLVAVFFGPREVAGAAFFCVDFFFLVKAINTSSRDSRKTESGINIRTVLETQLHRPAARWARDGPARAPDGPAAMPGCASYAVVFRKEMLENGRAADGAGYNAHRGTIRSRLALTMEGRMATRVADIQPFYVMDILARARALEARGRSIVHMEIGEPDFSTPPPIAAAGAQALAEGRSHYTPALGLPALREAIARDYRTRYGAMVAPGRVIVTPGASGALLLAAALLVDPGAGVLLPDPGYPCNRHFVRLFEGEAVSIPVGPETDYQLTTDMVRSRWSSRTAAVLMASPANPTGAVAAPELLAGLARTVAELGGTLIVDEIYHGLTYGGAAPSILNFTDEAVVINSFSKYFGMTGWRLGWMVVPERYVPHVDKLAQNLFLCAPTLAQHAALAAFDPGTARVLEQRRREFMARRDYLLPALRGLGFHIPATPRGAFYLYAGCRRFCRDSRAFAERLLEEAGVAVTPGMDFGRHEAAHHVRFAYTTSLENLREGVRRLGDYLG